MMKYINFDEFTKYLKIATTSLIKSIYDTVEHNGIEHSGYLAFLSFFSLFPFLIFIFSITGLIGASSYGVYLIETIMSIMPQNLSFIIVPRIKEIIVGPPNAFLTIAIVGIIWTASSIMEGCRTILNRAYRINHTPSYFLRRLRAIVEFMIISIFLITITFLFVITPNLLMKLYNDNYYIDYLLDGSIFYLRKLIIFLSLVFTVLLLNYILPSQKQKIYNLLPGSLITVFSWIVIKKVLILSFFFNAQFNVIYGSLAGIIFFLLLFYIGSMSFIIGAEFNYNLEKNLKNLK